LGYGLNSTGIGNTDQWATLDIICLTLADQAQNSILLRCDTTNQASIGTATYYRFQLYQNVAVSTWSIAKFIAGAATGLGTVTSPTVVASGTGQNVYRIRASCAGTTIKLELATSTDGGATFTAFSTLVSVTDASIASGNFSGMQVFPGNGVVAYTAGFVLDNFNVNSGTIAPPALVPGALTQGAVGLTTASITSAAATGGVAPYTYQWQRSLTSGSGFANVGGATSLTLNDTGLTSGTPYYYQLVVTDSQPVSATSAQQVEITTTVPSPIRVGIISDSIGTNTYGVSQEYIQFLAADGWHVTTLDNESVSGTSTSDWLAGGANEPTATANFTANLVNTVLIMLGTNDARVAGNSAATVAANLANIVTWVQLVPTVTRVIIAGSPYFVPGLLGNTVAQLALLQTYWPSYSSVVNNVKVFLAYDRLAFFYIGMNQSQLGDGVHPLTGQGSGSEHIAYLWAVGSRKALGFPNSGSGAGANSGAYARIGQGMG